MDAGKEAEEKQEKTPKFKFDTIEMLSEFRGENGSEGQYLLDKGEYYAAIKSFEKDLEKYPKSVYYLYGKGLSLAKLGNHKEATNYYSKVVETSDKYLIEYLPTFEELYEITLKALYEKWRSLQILGEREESAICLNRIRELSELAIYDKDGKILPIRYYSENKVWLYRAKALIRKGYVDACLNDLERASVVYKLGHIRSEWQPFADAIKQDKDFQTIVNDERFKSVIDKTPQLYDIFPIGWADKHTYDDIMCWFNGAKAYISKAQIDEGLRNLEEAINRYRLYVNNEWQLFADAIKQDKDFRTIINDERFKKLFI